MSEPIGPLWLRRLLHLDEIISSQLAAVGKPLERPAILIAHSGDAPLWLALGLGAAIWGGALGRELGLRIAIATLVGSGTAAVLKQVFRRGRPGKPFAALYHHIDQHAFPSAHATRSACITISLAPLLPVWGVILMGLWADLVALARVTLRIHFFLDVTGGLALGTLLGLLLVPIF